MADRRVTQTRKDEEGDILALCNPNADWSPRYKDDSIKDIEDEVHTYYVLFNNKRVDIHVVEDPDKGKYLRTKGDKTSRNNLDDLPDC